MLSYRLRQTVTEVFGTRWPAVFPFPLRLPSARVDRWIWRTPISIVMRDGSSNDCIGMYFYRLLKCLCSISDFLLWQCANFSDRYNYWGFPCGPGNLSCCCFFGEIEKKPSFLFFQNDKKKSKNVGIIKIIIIIITIIINTVLNVFYTVLIVFYSFWCII